MCLLITSRRQTGSRVPAAEDNEGGSGGGGDDDADDVEWGVYLRTEEDSDRTKKEWEKEHQDWEDEQVGRGRGRSVIQPAIFFSLTWRFLLRWLFLSSFVGRREGAKRGVVAPLLLSSLAFLSYLGVRSPLVLPSVFYDLWRRDLSPVSAWLALFFGFLPPGSRRSVFSLIELQQRVPTTCLALSFAFGSRRFDTKRFDQKCHVPPTMTYIFCKSSLLPGVFLCSSEITPLFLPSAYALYHDQRTS